MNAVRIHDYGGPDRLKLEQAPVPELKPDDVLVRVHAAAVPLAALTAWQALYDRADLKPGDRVLIHSGAGGVGTFAIQLAHLRRAYIYTTASAANAEFVRNLGADEVIDYTSEDFSTLDVVFDTLGGEVQGGCWQTLRRGGRLVSITQTPAPSTAEHYGVQAGFWFVHPNYAQLTEIAQLPDDGALRVFIDKTFPLEQVAEAHEESEGGHARGKIVLQAA